MNCTTTLKHKHPIPNLTLRSSIYQFIPFLKKLVPPAAHPSALLKTSCGYVLVSPKCVSKKAKDREPRVSSDFYLRFGRLWDMSFHSSSPTIQRVSCGQPFNVNFYLSLHGGIYPYSTPSFLKLVFGMIQEMRLPGHMTTLCPPLRLGSFVDV